MMVSLVDGIYHFIENEIQLRGTSPKSMCHIGVPTKVGQSPQDNT
jgi:hypothetical protein